MELTTAISSKQFFRDTYLHFMTFFSLIALIWRVNKLEEDFKVFYIVELFSRIFFFFGILQGITEILPHELFLQFW